MAISYLQTTGATGSYASTPDTAVLDITGDITLITKIQLPSWALGAAPQALVSKRVAAGNQRSYYFSVGGAGLFNLIQSGDGTAITTTSSITSPGFAADTTAWVMTTWNSSTTVTGFYTASGDLLTPPQPSDWLRLGTLVFGFGSTMFNGTAALEIGSTEAGTVQPTNGLFFRTLIYNGYFDGSSQAGSLVFDANFMTADAGAPTITDSASSLTVTVNGSAHISSRQALNGPGNMNRYVEVGDGMSRAEVAN